MNFFVALFLHFLRFYKGESLFVVAFLHFFPERNEVECMVLVLGNEHPVTCACVCACGRVCHRATSFALCLQCVCTNLFGI